MLVHPEDMGRPARGQDVGSIWTWREVGELRSRPGSTSVAWRRCERDLADDFAKPMRLLTNLLGAGHLGVEGWIQLDAGRNYLGPLPLSWGHHHPPLKNSAELKARSILGKN